MAALMLLAVVGMQWINRDDTESVGP